VRTSLAVAVRAVLSRRGRRRGVLLAMVGLAAAWCVLAGLAVGAMQRHESERTAAQQPVFGTTSEGLGWTELEHDFRGRDVRLVRVSDPGGDGPLLEGLSAWPEPGEALVTPALHNLMRDEPLVRQWFSDLRVDELSHEATGAADQLLAYVGVEAGDLRSGVPGPVVDFGGEAAGMDPYARLGCLVFLVLPGLALLLTGSRFGRQVRARRYQALRLLGVPARRARGVAATELALPVGLGAALAAVIWPWLPPETFTLPVTDRLVFGADLRPSVQESVLAVLAVTAVAAALGVTTAGSSGRGRRARGVRLLRSAHLTSPLVTLLFAAGLLLVGAAWYRREPRDPLLWWGIMLVGAGLPSAAAWVGQRLARWLGRAELGLVWLISTRRLAADAQSRFRTAGIVGIAVFAVGVAQPASQVLAQPTLSWVAQAREDGHGDLLARAESLEAGVPLRPGPPPDAVVAPVLAASVWTPEQGPDETPATEALVATCPQLEALFRQRLPDCDGGRMALGGAPQGPLLLRSADGEEEASLTMPRSSVTLPPQDMRVEATLVLPPDDPVLSDLGSVFHGRAYLRVAAEREAWEAAQAWIVAASPAHRLENAYVVNEVRDATGAWVLLGLITAAGIMALGALLVVAEDGGRRREWFALRALGVARVRLVGVQVTEALMAALVTVVLASGAGYAIGLAYLRVNEDSLTSQLPYVAAAGGGVVAVLLTSLLSSWAMLRGSARRGAARE
jgi:hypothetical protein